MPAHLVRSTCPFDCPDACGLLVEVEGGRAVSVRGDPEHPYSRGALCAKMTHYERTVHSPLRVMTPLARAGAKGSGEFRPIGWAEAIGTIGTRWRQLVAEHGAEAILPYSYAGTMGMVQRNAGHAFFHRLGASRLDRTICAPAKDAGWTAVMGGTFGPDPDEASQSDLIILWGINAVATNVHFLQRVKEARSKGARVWAIEVYQTPTTELGDRCVLVRPGSDGALALGLMHLLERDGRVDRAFVREQVQGYDELARKVLPEFPPERVAQLTGVSGEALEELAREFGRARAPFIRIGSGLSRYGNGAMNVRAIVCLPAVVGAYGKPGGGCFTTTSAAKAFSMKEVTREDFQPRPTRLVNMNQLGDALTQLDGPRVMSLYVYTSNPAAVAPDQNAVLRGLAREDLFTVVHERFLTDTARYADIVLPATTSLEHADLYRSYGQYAIQRARPALLPVGEAKSNWEVFKLLAEELGFREPFFRQSADDLIEGLLSAPSPMREGIDRRALDEGKAVGLAIPADARKRWATPSGRIEILNPALAQPLPCWMPAHEENGTLPFQLVMGVTPYSLNSSFQEREELREQQRGMRLGMNPADASERGLHDGERVVASNALGEVVFVLEVTPRVPRGRVVAEGVFWLAHVPGARNVNALTAQRLTDMAGGSTFSDNRVDVRRHA